MKTIASVTGRFFPTATPIRIIVTKGTAIEKSTGITGTTSGENFIGTNRCAITNRAGII